MKILSARKYSKGKVDTFIRGNINTVLNKMLKMIENDPMAVYDFLIDDNGYKKIVKSDQLSGEHIDIGKAVLHFTDNEIIIYYKIDESLPQQKTVDQLKYVRKLSKGTDIGDKIEDMNSLGNVQYERNPIDTGIESFQDFERNNKKFQINWNLKKKSKKQSKK